MSLNKEARSELYVIWGRPPYVKKTEARLQIIGRIRRDMVQIMGRVQRPHTS